jgi:hypothetical protein
VRDNPMEKNLGECSPYLTILGVDFSVQLAPLEAYGKVFGNARSAQLEFDHKLDIPVWWQARQFIRKDIRIFTNYRNFFKVRDNGHIGTRVCTILKR